MMDMSITAIRTAYAKQQLTPAELIAHIRQRCEAFKDRNIWIYALSEAELQTYLDGLAKKSQSECPLWGIPFVIKDNLDLAGVPTTAGCQAFAYTPEHSAFVVQRLLDAGAIPLGKANLDQFATGLNGTRSPWGACRNAFDPTYISGGSSSGSAVAVALGLASFSLGTDTAGSGRVPACFNNLVGLKPTRGLLSSSGLVPACRSLDCISIFALNCSDANEVLRCAEGTDPEDGYSRANPFANHARQFGFYDGGLTLGVIPPSQLQFFGDSAYAESYQKTLIQLQDDGIQLQELDYTPFDEAAKLLYEGPWVAERYVAIEPLLKSQPEALLPVIRSIIEPGGALLAKDLFRAQYRLEALKRQCAEQLAKVDALLTPTAGRLYSVAELQAEPIKLNSQLGYYTNFMNLLDLASVAVPTAFTRGGLPFGVTLVSHAFADRSLLSMAHRIQHIVALPSGASQRPFAPTPESSTGSQLCVQVAVCGAHLSGLPLNWQLTERGAERAETTQTAAAYRLYALSGGPPYRPGLVRDEAHGVAIEVEVWTVPVKELGSFVAAIPAPLGIGKLELCDGRWVSGFICEPYGAEGAQDISHLGGWRRYLEQESLT